MRKVFFIFVAVLIIATAGCAEKGNEFPETVRFNTNHESTILISSPNGVATGYVTDDPSSILDVPTGTWKFLQDNNSRTLTIVGTFEDLEKMPPIDIKVPEKSSRGLMKFIKAQLIEARIDGEGRQIFHLDVEQRRFEAINICVIDKDEFDRNWAQDNEVVFDLKEDQSNYRSPDIYKAHLTEEDIKNGRVWLVKISGRY